MRLKDDIYYLQQEVGDIKQESFAMQLIKESNAKNKIYEKQNKRLFIISVMAMLLLAVTFGYLVYTLKDIQTIEETSVDMDAEGSNNYIGGDNNGTYQSN